MDKASTADRDYFARVARANRALDSGRPPKSLDEMFDRLELIRRQLGPLAEPGIRGDGDGDLDGHHRFLARQHALLRRGTLRA